MKKNRFKITGIDITDWLISNIENAEENKRDCKFSIDLHQQFIDFTFDNNEFLYEITFEIFSPNKNPWFKFYSDSFISDIYKYIDFDFDRIDEICETIENKF